MKNRKLKVFLEKIHNKIKTNVYRKTFNKVYSKNNNFNKQIIQINHLFKMKNKKKKKNLH
jgi:hypothetical protein